MKEPPAQAEPRQAALRVEATEVQPENVPVVMVGHGETRSLNVVAGSAMAGSRSAGQDRRISTNSSHAVLTVVSILILSVLYSPSWCSFLVFFDGSSSGENG